MGPDAQMAVTVEAAAVVAVAETLEEAAVASVVIAQVATIWAGHSLLQRGLPSD